MQLTNWPCFIVAATVLTSVGICFKRFDFLFIDEVKALLSVLLGFSVSCLLLSFIWLLQKRPLNATWPMPNSGMLDAPSMHPRGRADSMNTQDYGRRATICTVSSLTDQPPNYEDALINSKPITWAYLHPDKPKLKSKLSSESYHLVCCLGHSNNLDIDNKIIDACCVCMDENGSRLSKSSSNSGVQLSRNGMNNLTNIATSQNGNININTDWQDITERKVSLCQLDASQLSLSCSPPKYHELNINMVHANF